MDLSNLKSDTQKIEILHPGTGAATGLVLEIASLESDVVKQVTRRQMDQAYRGRAKKKSTVQLEADFLERNCAAVVGWEWGGAASWGGAKLDFSKENVATVLRAPWVHQQVVEALNDEAGFFSN